MQAFHGDFRSEARLRAHYLLERRLAARLRSAPAVERSRVYEEVYGELFRALSDHPQRTRASDGRRDARGRMEVLIPYLGRGKTFLEIGCGDAVISVAVAEHVDHSYALDVTDALIDRARIPQNMSVLLTGGTEVPLPDASIDIALSDQLMEHLHPGDAEAQLTEVCRVLKSGGTYHCITPNRVTGPHDISCYFDYEATGFHLVEYDSARILRLFKEAGFRHVQFLAPVKGRQLALPYVMVRAIETALLALPPGARARASRSRLVNTLTGLHVVGAK